MSWFGRKTGSKPAIQIDLRLLRMALEDGCQEAMRREVNRQLADQMPGNSVNFKTLSVDCAIELPNLNLSVDGFDIEYVKEYEGQ